MSNAEKQIYRIEAKRHRERMDVRSEDPEHAIDAFFKTIAPEKDQIIAAYWPKGREFDTSALIHRFWEDGYQCVLPIVQKDSKELLFANCDESTKMEKGAFDIVQPKIDEDTEFLKPDIVVVPLLAFDRRGHRLGYGGGYYDATLSALRSEKEIITIGWGYSQQAVLFNLPAESHDQPLDYVITPKGVHSFVNQA